jgi:hypothetical protein
VPVVPRGVIRAWNPTRRRSSRSIQLVADSIPRKSEKGWFGLDGMEKKKDLFLDN